MAIRKPCPFCGGTATVISNGLGHYAQCVQCDAEGPSGESVEDAERLWDTRVPSHVRESAPEADRLAQIREQKLSAALRTLRELEAQGSKDATAALEGIERIDIPRERTPR